MTGTPPSRDGSCTQSMSRIIRQAYARLPTDARVSHASSAPGFLPNQRPAWSAGRNARRRRRLRKTNRISTRLCALRRSMTLTVGSIADAALMSRC